MKIEKNQQTIKMSAEQIHAFRLEWCVQHLDKAKRIYALILDTSEVTAEWEGARDATKLKIAKLERELFKLVLEAFGK